LEVELLHCTDGRTDKQTDRHDRSNSDSHNFANAPRSELNLCELNLPRPKMKYYPVIWLKEAIKTEKAPRQHAGSPVWEFSALELPHNLESRNDSPPRYFVSLRCPIG
jgi:hypothetical protein